MKISYFCSMVKVLRYIQSLWEGVLELFYPALCPICDTPLEKGEYVCPSCHKTLRRTEQAIIRGNSTEQLFMGNKRFERGGAYLFFEKGGDVQKMILNFKFARRPEIGYELAKEAALAFMEAGFFEGIDVIIPVPLHPRRLRERGYNQAEVIAKGVHEVTHIAVDTTHLMRIKNNKHQAALRGMKREKNVEDIFAVVHPEDMYRKHILLVDDVITTGNTLCSCMKAMGKFRGCRISVFALGKAIG